MASQRKRTLRNATQRNSDTPSWSFATDSQSERNRRLLGSLERKTDERELFERYSSRSVEGEMRSVLLRGKTSLRFLEGSTPTIYTKNCPFELRTSHPNTRKQTSQSQLSSESLRARARRSPRPSHSLRPSHTPPTVSSLFGKAIRSGGAPSRSNHIRRALERSTSS